MSTQDWERVIGTLGVPVAILVAVAFALRNLANWARPLVDRVVTAHLNTMEANNQTLAKLQERSAANGRTLDELAESQAHCARTSESLVHASRAIEAIAPEDRRPQVLPHTEEMRRALKE